MGNSLDNLFGKKTEVVKEIKPQPVVTPHQALAKSLPTTQNFPSTGAILKQTVNGLKFGGMKDATPTSPTPANPPQTPIIAAHVESDLAGIDFTDPQVIGKVDVNMEDQKLDVMEGEELEKLQNNLSHIQEAFNHPEIVGDAIRNIMLLLQQYPFLKDNMKPEDCGVMVKGLRESYGRTIAKKVEKKGKRTAKAKEADDIFDALGDMGI